LKKIDKESEIMGDTYGLWHRGIKPSNWIPDYGQCLKEEIKRWERDLEREKKGEKDFEGYWGIGIYS
jgi:hypothetical protein